MDATVLTLQVPQDLKNNLSRLAHKRGVSLNQLANYLLLQGIQTLHDAERLTTLFPEKPLNELENNFDVVWNALKERNGDNPIPAWDRVE